MQNSNPNIHRAILEIQNLFLAVKTRIDSILQDCFNFTCEKIMANHELEAQEEVLQNFNNGFSEKVDFECPLDEKFTEMLVDFEKNFNDIMESKANQIILDMENNKTLDFLLSDLKIKDTIIYKSKKGCIGYAIAVIPPWDMLSIGTNEGDIFSFDTQNFELKYQYERAHSEWIMCLVYNDELNLLLSASTDKTIKVFSIQDKHLILLKSLNSHKASVNGISFIPNQNIFISFGRGNEIKLWNTHSLLEIHTIVCDEDKMGCQSCYIESLKSFGIGFYAGKIKFFNIFSKDCILTLDVNKSGYYINSLIYDSVSQKLIAQINSKTIGIWKLKKNAFEYENQIKVKGHANNFILLSNFLFTCCDHPNIEIWDIIKLNKVQEISLPTQMRNSNGILIFDRNNTKYLTVSSWNVNKLVVFHQNL